MKHIGIICGASISILLLIIIANLAVAGQWSLALVFGVMLPIAISGLIQEIKEVKNGNIN